MATGEGKTLVATSCIFKSLAKRGVHIVTVNDYLPDVTANGWDQSSSFMMNVDCIDKHEPNSDERKKHYRGRYCLWK